MQQHIGWWERTRQYFGPDQPWFSLSTVLASTCLALILCARADVKIGDWLLTNWSGATTNESGIVIVAIDEQTLAGLPYRSPLDRAFLAELITHI